MRSAIGNLRVSPKWGRTREIRPEATPTAGAVAVLREKRRIMRKSIEAFEFEHDGRTYICTPEARAGGKKEMWWWFRVSGDAQRYAPFEVVAGESKDAVAKRIVTWHATMLERRSAPAVSPQAWWQRRKQAASE
jgi:hypothetical protein